MFRNDQPTKKTTIQVVVIGLHWKENKWSNSFKDITGDQLKARKEDGIIALALWVHLK